MNLAASFFEALESLASNKLRSGLTILGIVIGVAAVIAMISIGRGAENSITGSIQGIGTNLLFVFRGGNEDVRNPKPLTLGDANAINDPFQAPSVANVAPMLMGNGKVSYNGESVVTSIEGVTPSFAEVRNYRVTEGEFIAEEHILGRSSVALLGPDVAKKTLWTERGPGRRDGAHRRATVSRHGRFGIERRFFVLQPG
jgi:putative ABC transport system permease protein